jgi:hypothetical protein
MFVGNEEVVYLLDKAEGNAAQINGHSAWGAFWFVAMLVFPLINSNKFIKGYVLSPINCYGSEDQHFLLIWNAFAQRFIRHLWRKRCRRTRWSYRI